MSTDTATTSPSENVFSRILITLIRTKYLTATNPADIWYRILTNLICASFLQYISSWVRGRGSLSTHFSPFKYWIMYNPMTGNTPRCPLRCHSLVCIKNYLSIVVIGPIQDIELIYIFSICFFCLCFWLKKVLITRR